VVGAFATPAFTVAIARLLSVIAVLAQTVIASTERALAKMAGQAKTVKSLNVRMIAPATVFAMMERASATLGGLDLIVPQRSAPGNLTKTRAVDTECAIALACSAIAMRNGLRLTAREEPARTIAAITEFATTERAHALRDGRARIVVKLPA